MYVSVPTVRDSLHVPVDSSTFLTDFRTVEMVLYYVSRALCCPSSEQLNSNGVIVDLPSVRYILIAMDIIVQGSNGHPEGQVWCRQSNIDPLILTTSEIHMDHAEVGPWIPCLKLAETTKKGMILSAGKALKLLFVWHITTKTITVYAANLLFAQASPVDESTITIDAASLDKLTLAVERELRAINVQQMRATEFRYRVNIHSHFNAPDMKGATTNKILYHDTNGSRILIKGPYATSVDAAISVLEAELLRKLQERSVDPEKAADQDWMVNVLNDGAKYDEPGMPCATWAAVNFSVVSQVVAEEKAAEDETMCHGDYVQTMGGIQPPIV